MKFYSGKEWLRQVRAESQQKERAGGKPPPGLFFTNKKMRQLLLHAFFEHRFAFVSSGFASASGVLGPHCGSFGCSGAGCTLLFDGLSLIHSCLAKLRAFLAIILAGTSRNHRKSQCNNKQNCHYSLHSLSSLETDK
jgi:hypothetical protein